MSSLEIGSEIYSFVPSDTGGFFISMSVESIDDESGEISLVRDNGESGVYSVDYLEDMLNASYNPDYIPSMNKWFWTPNGAVTNYTSHLTAKRNALDEEISRSESALKLFQSGA